MVASDPPFSDGGSGVSGIQREKSPQARGDDGNQDKGAEGGSQDTNSGKATQGSASVDVEALPQTNVDSRGHRESEVPRESREKSAQKKMDARANRAARLFRSGALAPAAPVQTINQPQGVAAGAAKYTRREEDRSLRAHMDLLGLEAASLVVHSSSQGVFAGLLTEVLMSEQEGISTFGLDFSEVTEPYRAVYPVFNSRRVVGERMMIFYKMGEGDRLAKCIGKKDAMGSQISWAGNLNLGTGGTAIQVSWTASYFGGAGGRSAGWLWGLEEVGKRREWRAVEAEASRIISEMLRTAQGERGRGRHVLG